MIQEEDGAKVGCVDTFASKVRRARRLTAYSVNQTVLFAATVSIRGIALGVGTKNCQSCRVKTFKQAT